MSQRFGKCPPSCVSLQCPCSRSEAGIVSRLQSCHPAAVASFPSTAALQACTHPGELELLPTGGCASLQPPAEQDEGQHGH